MATTFTPFFQALDANGDPYSGAKLYFYRTGTSTLLDTYTTSALTTANSNPVVADSAGRFGPIYLGTSYDYKAILTTSTGLGDTIATFDPIFASSTAGRVAVADAAYALTAPDRLIAYTSISAARTLTLLAASAYTAGTILTIVDESGSASSTNTISVGPNGSDTINGLNTTQVVISSARGSVQMESDGTSKWTILRNTDGRRAIADAAATVTARDSLVSYTSITTARTVTLPAATAYPAGKRLVIADESGSVTGVIAISVAPNGTDKIGSLNATRVMISTAYACCELVSNGVDAWDIIAANSLGGTWTPADGSGAALSLTGVTARYQIYGALVYAYFSLTYPATGDGSNTLISGLPFTAGNFDYASVAAILHNSGGGALTYGKLVKNTATFEIRSGTAARYTNIQLSGLTISGIITYPLS